MVAMASGSMSLPSWKSTLHHLQALQSAQPLDVPSACFTVDPSFSRPEVGELFVEASSANGLGSAPHLSGGGTGDAAVSSKVQDSMKLAEFWISMQEGELQDLREEVAKQKQRHKEAMRQAEAKASALRESEAERKRLQAELHRQQQSRVEAVCKLNIQKQDVEKKQGDVESMAARAESLEEELRQERESKTQTEEQLVKVIVRYAEALKRSDTLEAAMEHYEGLLRSYNPAFEPVDLSSFGKFSRPKESESDTETETVVSEAPTASVETPASQISKDLKKGLGLKRGLGLKLAIKKIFGGSNSSKKKDREDGEDKEAVDQDHPASPQATLQGEEARGSRRPSTAAGGESHSATVGPNEPSSGDAGSPGPATSRRRRWEMRVE